jgi:hypothetical protein
MDQGAGLSDTAVAAGAENRVTNCLKQLTARPPITFAEFVANNNNWQEHS